jgi:endonuclease/exonuclease/phosphatase family metal-dependent hydrolase
LRKAISKIGFYINVAAALALLFASVSVYIPPDKWWLPALFGLAYPFFLLINLGFIIYWTIHKSRYLWISLLPVLLFMGLFSRHFQLFGRKTGETGIKFLSYNVKHFTGDLNKKAKNNADIIVEFLKENEADIICLQEVRLRTNSVFNIEKTIKQLKTIKHYQYARSSTTYGSVTLTRYPIVNMGEVRFKKSRNITIFTDVIINKDTVRIFNVHLQSYHIDPNDYSILESPLPNETRDLREVQVLTQKLVTAFQQRAEQARVIDRYISESPHPVIVCGDFNDTPASFSYRRIKGGLRDAYVGSGKGIGKTYIGKLPSFRIDYILHSRKFKSYNFKTIDFKLSDHLPITCNLVLK